MQQMFSCPDKMGNKFAWLFFFSNWDKPLQRSALMLFSTMTMVQVLYIEDTWVFARISDVIMTVMKILTSNLALLYEYIF